MFGASEDRARQLAYRKRRERVISGSSSSTYRSLSSASRISQRSRVSSALDQEGVRSFLATQRGLPQPGHGTVDFTTNSLGLQGDGESISATEAQHLQMERHRLQAEYLSQVLYNSLSLATAGAQPDDTLMPTMNVGRYGALGKPATSRHIRNVTAPVASLEMQPLLVSTMKHSSESGALPLLHRTARNAQLRTQTMVVLRGGGDHDPSLQQETTRRDPPFPGFANSVAQSAQPPPADHSRTRVAVAPVPQEVIQVHNPQREYMQTCPWVQRYYDKPAWVVPISIGQHFHDFMASLPADWHSIFLALFGPEQSPDHPLSSRANARRDFFQKLNPGRQVIFHSMIQSRVIELQAVAEGFDDPEFIAPFRGASQVMLYHLMEAREARILPHPRDYRDFALYTVLMQASSIPLPPMSPLNPLNSLVPRSSSAPNFGQHPQHSGYLPRTLH